MSLFEQVASAAAVATLFTAQMYNIRAWCIIEFMFATACVRTMIRLAMMFR